MPQSIQCPSNLNPYIPLSRSFGNTSRSIETKPSPMKSRTSRSSAYAPALMRLENASSLLGFSWNLVILESPSTCATPKGEGSSTGQRDIDAMPSLALWNLRNEATSRDVMTSPFMTRNRPSMRSSTFFTAPPVPSGSGSSTRVILLDGGWARRCSSMTSLL